MRPIALCILFSVTCLYTFSADAYEYVRPDRPHFRITSEKADSTLLPSSYRIHGQVHLGDVPMPGVPIFTENEVYITRTDATGSFDLVIDAAKSFGDVFCEADSCKLIKVGVANFKPGYVYTIDFRPHKGGDGDGEMMVKKPVIYCYSDQPIEATLTVIAKGEITFTYPGNEPSWNVVVSPEGMTNSADQRSYPYLFWEATTSHLELRKVDEEIYSDVVEKNDVVDYFEIALTALGLNEKERTDFITFWAPQMLNSEHFLINWVIDEQCNAVIGALNVEPKPDNFRRIYMLYAPVDKEDISNYLSDKNSLGTDTVTPIQRNGFTVIEWGGAELNRISLEGL